MDYYEGRNQNNPGSFKGYQGTTIYCGGLIGFWVYTDNNSTWFLEEYIPRPTFTNTSSQITVSDSEANTTIYYTTDSSNPTTTNYTGKGAAPLQIGMLANTAKLRTIAVTADNLPSCVSEISVVPAASITLASATLTYNGGAQTPSVSSVKNGETVIPTNEYAVSYSNNTQAGAATVTITDEEGGNYIVYGSATFTIHPKPLTITANPKTITYGEAPANDGVTYGEFAAGESRNMLTGTLAFTYNYAQYGNVGAYTITPSGLSNSNYDITFVGGTLTVGQKEVGLAWNTKTSFTYDGSAHAPGVSATGVVNGDEVAVTVAGAQTNAGNGYIATASALTGSKAVNYKLPSATTQAFSITKAALTVTAQNHTITYGDAPSGNGVTYHGFVKDETASVLGGSLAYSFSYTQYGNIGNSYTITPKGLTSGNYAITYANGTLTVIPKAVGVEWTDTEFTYNGNGQAPTATATGLVNNDDVAVTVSGAQVNAGEHTATASTLTGSQKDNYTLPEGITQTFTIAPKSLGDGNQAAEGIQIEMTPTGELQAVKDGSRTLTEHTDYTQTTTEDGSDKVVTITGRGNYKDAAVGIYASPTFTDPDGDQSEKAAAVYQAKRDMQAPTGITPYIVRKVNPSIGTMTITPLDYIPEGVPVLLLSDKEAEGFVASPKAEATLEIAAETRNSNQLKMAPDDGVAVEAAQIYTFYRGEFVLTKKGTLSKGRFYIQNPNYTASLAAAGGQASAPSLSVLRFVMEEEPTGIEAMERIDQQLSTSKSAAWHTLDGRRLQEEPTKPGLYILNGRKTIIRKR
ncbi:MAG: chitobiase/beta-hexosaminidase C-terminal domain-containing protein [Prevotella sp.]|nr:chitobiase/beta-hexosaminidase C-terminal domain-containing protein [Prevotella sp.]